MNKKETFREYLMEKCMNETHALDDMLPDVYEDWITAQDIEDIIDWAEKWAKPTTPVDSKPEHKSIEGLRKAYSVGLDEVFEDSQSYTGVMSPEDHLFEAVLDYSFRFFEPHLNSRNLLERFANAYFEFAKTDDGQGGLELCSTKVEFFMFLDEFIESELHGSK